MFADIKTFNEPLFALKKLPTGTFSHKRKTVLLGGNTEM